MDKADALSWMTGLETGVNDNKDIVLLKPEFFIQALRLGNPEDRLIDEIQKNVQTVDAHVTDMLKAGDKDWTFEDDMFYWKNRIYVPKNQELRGKIIKAHHDSILTGHPGQYKTWELVTHTYWWPSVNRDIA